MDERVEFQRIYRRLRAPLRRRWMCEVALLAAAAACLAAALQAVIAPVGATGPGWGLRLAAAGVAVLIGLRICPLGPLREGLVLDDALDAGGALGAVLELIRGPRAPQGAVEYLAIRSWRRRLTAVAATDRVQRFGARPVFPVLLAVAFLLLCGVWWDRVLPGGGRSSTMATGLAADGGSALAAGAERSSDEGRSTVAEIAGEVAALRAERANGNLASEAFAARLRSAARRMARSGAMGPGAGNAEGGGARRGSDPGSVAARGTDRAGTGAARGGSSGAEARGAGVGSVDLPEPYRAIVESYFRRDQKL